MARQSQIQFTIPEPCNLSWEGMTPVDKDQRHCSSCDKVVTDFSKMSDDELMLFFRHSNGKICGRLSQQQMNRPLFLLPEKTVNAKWWKTFLLIPLTLFGKSTQAQIDSVPYENHPKDTNVLSQVNLAENGFGVKSIEIIRKEYVTDNAVSLTITHPDTTLYKYVWAPQIQSYSPNIIYYPDKNYPLCSTGTMIVLEGPLIQPFIYGDILFDPIPSFDLNGGCWPRTHGIPVPEAAFEKSIFTILLDTIVPFRRKKSQTIVSSKNSQTIAQPEPYKEISQQPPQKPKPQQPALPASNEITGILPEDRKKYWRS